MKKIISILLAVVCLGALCTFGTFAATENAEEAEFVALVVCKPDDTGFSRVLFIFNDFMEYTNGGFEAGWGVGYVSEDGEDYTTIDSRNWGDCTWEWDYLTQTTVFNSNMCMLPGELPDGATLYDLAKEGKVYGFVMEHPVSQEEDGFVDASNSCTRIKATGNYSMGWNGHNASYGASVQAIVEDDYAPETFELETEAQETEYVPPKKDETTAAVVDTNAPAEESKTGTGAAETKANESKKGCGSVIASSMMIVMLLGTAVVIKRK